MNAKRRNSSFILFQSSSPPLLDWSGVPTLVLLVIAIVVAVTALAVRTNDSKQPSHLPGPRPLPFLGTRWLFWSRYKMNKLHEAYEGKILFYILTYLSTCFTDYLL